MTNTINEDDIKLLVRKLARQAVNRGKSAVELRGMAVQQLMSDPAARTVIDLDTKFTLVSERRIAKDLLNQYLTDYQIESISDRNTLVEIIYLEVIQTRLQDKLNELYSNQVKAIPYDIVGLIHKNSEAILKLKATLGLNKTNRDRLAPYDALDHLRRRWVVWRSQNQASRTMKCPHCSKFVLLKMRMTHWDAQRHPFFQDNMVYNAHLFKHLGQTVTIDNDFIAGVLETSRDYVDTVVARSRRQPQESTNGHKVETQSQTSQETQIDVPVSPTT